MPTQPPSGGCEGTHHRGFGTGGGYGPTRQASAKRGGSARNRLPAPPFSDGGVGQAASEPATGGHRLSAGGARPNAFGQRERHQRLWYPNQPDRFPWPNGAHGTACRPVGNQGKGLPRPPRRTGQLAVRSSRRTTTLGRWCSASRWDALFGERTTGRAVGPGAWAYRCSARSSDRRADRKVDPDRGGIFGTRSGGSHPNRATWARPFGV